MKKKLLLPVTFLIFIISLSSCIFLGPSIKGNGHVTSEKRKVGEFSQVKVSTGMKVILHQSDHEQVTVLADENLHEAIRTEVHGDELQIFTDQRIRRSRKLQITVDFKDLDAVRTSSGAQVNTDGAIRAKQFSTRASSGSQQSLEIKASDLSARTSSGASIHLQGSSNDADLRASSGSHLKAGALTTENCTADVSSGAHIYIDITGDFEGEASSGGHIYYTGEPKRMNIHTSSGGEIRKQ